MKSIVYPAVILAVSVLVTAFNIPKAGNEKQAHSYVAHYENVLGTSMELKVSALSEKQAAIAEKAALAEIDRLSKILSGYDANSEFSKWFSTINQPVHVSKDLFTVLSLFDQWHQQTNGALDASAELISKIWKQAAANQQLPSQQILNNAVAQVQQKHWILDEANQTATHLTTTPLKLNSFAKSYIIQSSVNAAKSAAKINGLIVNIGGDMVIDGNINENVWISDPKANAENDAPVDQIIVTDKAVASSGNYRRGELINGNWYSHIVDPRTGKPSGEIISSTVVAPSATDAGALATAFNVLTPAECITLAATIPGVEYLLITKTGERIESNGWKSLQIKHAVSTTVLTENQKDWKNELLITLNLAQQQGFAKRPFVAVWVEDKDGNTVRNIALWYNKPRWLHDLRAWYRKNNDAFATDMNVFYSVTGATRSAGKYTLKWDGKDDKGKVLKPGTYTIYFEAAREHGGYDLLHQEINCNESAQQFTLKGEAEIESVSLEYKKK